MFSAEMRLAEQQRLLLFEPVLPDLLPAALTVQAGRVAQLTAIDQLVHAIHFVPCQCLHHDYSSERSSADRRLVSTAIMLLMIPSVCWGVITSLLQCYLARPCCVTLSYQLLLKYYSFAHCLQVHIGDTCSWSLFVDNTVLEAMFCALDLTLSSAYSKLKHGC